MSRMPLLLLLGFSVQQAGGEAQDALLRALHGAFASNTASFPFGRITFRHVQGSAPSAEAARRGEFDPRYVADGLYCFDSKTARFERLFSEEQMRNSNIYTDNTVTSILSSFRALTDGELTLEDSISAKRKAGTSRSISLTPGTSAFESVFRFPLSLGRAEHPGLENFGKYLEDSLRGDGESRIAAVERDVAYEDRKVVKVTFAWRNGTGEYWIDAERGAVPLRIVDRISREDLRPTGYDTEYLFDDVRHVPGRGWLPFKQSWWSSFDDRGGQIVLTDASFDSTPAASDLALTFPEPVGLINEAKSLRYPKRKTWDLSKLPSDHSSAVEKVRMATIPMSEVPQMPGEREGPGSRYDLLLAGFSLLALTGVLIAWGRGRFHGSAG